MKKWMRSRLSWDTPKWHESWYTIHNIAPQRVRALGCSHVSEAPAFPGDSGPRKGRLYNHGERSVHPRCAHGKLPGDAASAGRLWRISHGWAPLLHRSPCGYPSALCKSKPKQCFNQIYMLCRAIHERHEKDVSLSNTLFILALSQRHEYMTWIRSTFTGMRVFTKMRLLRLCIFLC